jgi:hypothetical protein
MLLVSRLLHFNCFYCSNSGHAVTLVIGAILVVIAYLFFNLDKEKEIKKNEK